MKFYSVKILFVLYISAFALYAGPDEYSLSVVPLKNFSESVFSEGVSRYRLRSSDSGFSLPDTPFQKVLKRVKGGADFVLEVACGSRVGAEPSRGPDDVEETRFLDFSEPEMRALKEKFKGSRDVIGDVEKFVYSRISTKKMGIPILPASDILKNMAGDCTEHAVLSAAILRSMGIPARAVTGMLLSREFGIYKNVFIYHMWVEAFSNGKWILVDATRPGEKCPNRYIAFAYHHLKTEMPLVFLKAISAMKNFTAEYAGGR